MNLNTTSVPENTVVCPLVAPSARPARRPRPRLRAAFRRDRSHGRLHAAELRPALMLVSVPLPYYPPFHSSSRTGRDETTRNAGQARVTLSDFKRLLPRAKLAGRRGLLRR